MKCPKALILILEVKVPLKLNFNKSLSGKVPTVSPGHTQLITVETLLLIFQDLMFLSIGDRDLGLHSILTRGVRPHLEGKQRTPLSSRVATGISWIPLSGLCSVGEL